MSKIQLFENTSEIGAGTRGSSLGVEALKIAALNSNSTGRKNLWSTSNLNYTGVNAAPTLCAADFYAERKEICKGNAMPS